MVVTSLKLRTLPASKRGRLALDTVADAVALRQWRATPQRGPNGRADHQKSLRLPGRLEAAHVAFPLPAGLVGQLGPVVFVPPGSMDSRQAGVCVGGRSAFQRTHRAAIRVVVSGRLYMVRMKSKRKRAFMTNTQFLHVLGNAYHRAGFSIGVALRRHRELHKVVATDPDEVRPYCYFDKPAEKERGAVDRFATRFKA